jgi:Xaa-Pro aminopeptidase
MAVGLKTTIVASILILLIAIPIKAPAREFDSSPFLARRQALLERMPEGSILLLMSAEEKMRNGDTEYPFHQDCDFYYLTGFEEPESACLLERGSGRPFTLFVRPRDPAVERWTGRRCGLESAMTTFKADTAFAISELADRLGQTLQGKSKCFLLFGDSVAKSLVDAAVRANPESPPPEIANANALLNKMRSIKDAGEIARMRRAAGITGDGIRDVLATVRPGWFEYQVQAKLEYRYRMEGCKHDAFPVIAGSGPNALVLHYMSNDGVIGRGDLVLIDTGAEYEHYCADITRTIPANGTFTSVQKDLYGIVLEALEHGIRAATAGAPANAVQNNAFKRLSAGLLELGLVADTAKSWQAWAWIGHGLSHPLGLDVHDPPPSVWWGADTSRLMAGMVITVEPGLYIDESVLDAGGWRTRNIPPDEFTAFVDKVRPAVMRYRGIGIRIEDDVLVTAAGPEVLTAATPKSILDIERLMRR